jgi:regulator of protease activity HflC (stomatin/prohibitin superfamily)
MQQMLKGQNALIFGIVLLFLGIVGGSGLLAFLGIFLLLSSYKDIDQLKRTISTHFLSNIFKSKQPMETLDPRKHKKIAKMLIPVIIILIVLPFASSFWTVVDAGQTGVSSFFGKVRDTEFPSGFHLKNPLVRITKMNIRTQSYTMSIVHEEGKKLGNDAISALTKEGLSVDLDITVLYNLQSEKASDVYRDVGVKYEEVIIRPQIRSIIREVIAEYTAKDIYSEKRQEATSEILKRLQTSVHARGIEVEEVLLRNVQLPANLANSIQEKLQAEQEAQRYDFVLEREEKEAERKRVEAAGQRDAQKIINQSLTQNYLNYLYINSLQDREGTIYVPVNPNNGVPLFRGL